MEYAVSKRHLNVCKLPVQTPFCIVMNTVLGSSIKKKWRNPKSNARSFGSHEFDQGSVQSFLSTQRWKRNWKEYIYIHKPIDCPSQWSLVGLTRLRKSMFPFFLKVMTTPTNPPLELGRRISGKTKDDNLGGNSSSWGQLMKTPSSLWAFYSIKSCISGAG